MNVSNDELMDFQQTFDLFDTDVIILESTVNLGMLLFKSLIINFINNAIVT